MIRVRLGGRLAHLGASPTVVLELADGATVQDALARLRVAHPDLAPALPSALSVVAGEHVRGDRRLADREEIALLLPVSGG